MIRRNGTNKITKVLRALALGMVITASGLIVEAPAQANAATTGRYYWYDQATYTNEQHMYTYTAPSGSLVTTDDYSIAKIGAIGEIQTKANTLTINEKMDSNLDLGKQESTSPTIIEQELSQEEYKRIASEEMLRLVNVHRVENGIAPLARSKELDDSATIKSKHMVANGYYAHNWNGIDFKDLSKQIGGAEISRENIDLTTCAYFERTLDNAKATARNIFADWKNSPGHDAAMLDADYTETGFGFTKGNWKGWDACYATQQFR